MHFLSQTNNPSSLFRVLCWFIVFCVPFSVNSQSKGLVKGKIFDKSDKFPLAEVKIWKKDSIKFFYSGADGGYLMELTEGEHTLIISGDGFTSTSITKVPVRAGEITYLDIYLQPANVGMQQVKETSDSIPATIISDTLDRITYSEACSEATSVAHSDDLINGMTIPSQAIAPGTDKDLNAILGRLNGVTSWQEKPFSNRQFLIVNGLGERFNQVRLNGQVMQSFDPLSKQYPFSFLPAEAIESVRLRDHGDASIPADYAGGNIEIRTKNIPDRNFIYVQVGGELLPDSYSKKFYGNKPQTSEWLSLPVSEKKLPHDFPSTRSQFPLSSKNAQEQSDLLGMLNNNLAPQESGNIPGTRFLAGIGRKFKLKSGAQWGFSAYIYHQLQEVIDESTIHSSPSLLSNPYPFVNNNKPLINAFSEDINYRFQSQLGAIFNTGVNFGKNKISLSSIFGNQYQDTYTERGTILKPDEDSLAIKAVRYTPEQRKFANLQLNGEHALGLQGKFRLSWQFAYSHYQQLNPDDRNFLLRQDSADATKYEIARPQTGPVPDRDNIGSSALDANLAAILTNTARTWRTQKDNHFSGWANIDFPFTMLGYSQMFTGGIFIQTSNREFYTDQLLYKGTGYVNLDSLIEPSRYYPGGVSVEEYYTKVISSSGFFSSADLNADNLGNHTGSVNTGASFMQYSGQLTPWLKAKAGLRFESGSMLISSSEYYYYEGFKNAQIISLDENATVAKYDLLPSLEITLKPVREISFTTSYYKTINRPMLQELSSFRYYDAGTFLVRSGNPFLENSEINNFSAGLQWAAKNNFTIGVSGFYKDIYKPIENIITLYPGSTANYLSTPHNVPNTTVYGIKTSFLMPLVKKMNNWLSDLSVYGSGTWTTSEVEAGPVRSISAPNVSSHSLAGSPEYMANGGIILQHRQWPQFSLHYQYTSDYLHSAGSGAKVYGSNGDAVYAIPDYRVKGMSQLNVQVSHLFFKSTLQVIAGATNVLNSPFIIYQDLNGNKSFDEPLVISKSGPNRGFYISGTDNTIQETNNQRSFFLRLSYTIN